MTNLTKSKATNINVFDGNSLSIFIDADTNELSLRDIRGNKERLDNFVTEGLFVRGSGQQGILPTGQYANNEGNYSSILGGFANLIIGKSHCSTILGGRENSISNSSVSIAFGQENEINAPVLFGIILNGETNELQDSNSPTIINGIGNIVSSDYGFIGNGNSNLVAENFGFIGSGFLNTVSGEGSAILGGEENLASGQYTSVIGGRCNTADAGCSVVIGGFSNTANNTCAVVIGGGLNNANGFAGFIGAGRENTIDNTGNCSFIGAGRQNLIEGCHSAINSGFANQINEIYGFIGSGLNNVIENEYSSIINGVDNFISGSFSTILGGQNNDTNDFNNVHVIGSNITATRPNSTFVENLNITEEPDTSTSAFGALVREPSSKDIQIFSGFNRGLFTQTADGTEIVNTTTETELIGSGVGTLTVPASTFKVGDTFMLKMGGNISSNNENLDIRIKTNDGENTVVLAFNNTQTIPTITNDRFELNVHFTVRDIGASGTASVSTMASMFFAKSSNGILEGFEFGKVESTLFNTTLQNKLSITAQWGVANASNSIQSTFFTLQKIY